MRTETFRSGAWHHRLAQFGGLSDYEEETDICRYLRCMFKAVIGILFLAFVLLVFGGGALWSFGDCIGWLVAGIRNGFVAPRKAVGALVMSGVAAISVFLWCVVYIAKATSRATASAPPDTFIGSARESIKERVCFRVVIR